MRRGSKPAKTKVEAKLPVARKLRKNEGARNRQLEKRLAEALKREAQALEQQTATAEILRVMSGLPTVSPSSMPLRRVRHGCATPRTSASPWWTRMC
jgi:hypothetical protein